MSYFDQLEPLLQIFWYIALPVSVVFALQTLFSFIGIGDHAADEIVVHPGENIGDGFQLFSFRNIVNFLLGFSWTGISLFDSIRSPYLLLGISLGVGIVFVVVTRFIIRQVRRLSEDNSFRYTDAIAQTGEVYLSIPAHQEGSGKVLLSVKGTVRELEAVSKSDRLESGTPVKVIGIENETLLIVEKIH